MSLITTKEAQVLCENFINTKSPELDKITGKEDANNIWFSIEDLENFLTTAREQLNAEGKSIDGVRVYLGSYPENYEEKNKANMTTVFMVATSENEEGLSIDYQGVVMNRGLSGEPPKKQF